MKSIMSDEETRAGDGPARGWVFIVSPLCVIALSWYAMSAVHELGHVINALLSGGRGISVHLPPFSFSRTDIATNPHPTFVAWGGFAWGVALPFVITLLTTNRSKTISNPLKFWCGFCFLTNGIYLLAGPWMISGDSRDLLDAHTPQFLLVLLGTLLVIIALARWHSLGTRLGLDDRTATRRRAIRLLVAIAVVIGTELWVSG